MYVEKAAETTFVRKMRTNNVDEIDTRREKKNGQKVSILYSKLKSMNTIFMMKLFSGTIYFGQTLETQLVVNFLTMYYNN
jgi:hypothetical protein